MPWQIPQNTCVFRVENRRSDDAGSAALASALVRKAKKAHAIDQAQRALSASAALGALAAIVHERRSLSKEARIGAPMPPTLLHGASGYFLLWPCMHVVGASRLSACTTGSCMALSVIFAFVLSLARGENSVNIEVFVCSQHALFRWFLSFKTLLLEPWAQPRASCASAGALWGVCGFGSALCVTSMRCFNGVFVQKATACGHHALDCGGGVLLRLLSGIFRVCLGEKAAPTPVQPSNRNRSSLRSSGPASIYTWSFLESNFRSMMCYLSERTACAAHTWRSP